MFSRPIAKENNVGCLIGLFNNKKYAARAEQVIWNLINDKDSIIRITAFDRIENILDIDKDFGYKILNHIIQKSQDLELVKRAKEVIESHKML